ncbi:MAG: SPOR domain-containing protein [Gammaproteobacteria bacterium]|jgi:cell division protein FtsN
MPRDYKHRANPRRKRSTLSPLVGVLAGLLIGLFVAFLVYIKSRAEPREPVYIQETLPPPVATSNEQAASDVHSDETTPHPPPPKPRFDFYTLLPEMEVVIPEEEITESLKKTPLPPATPPPASEAEPVPQRKPEPAAITTPAATPKPAAPATPTGTYYLQVGSFSEGAKAERFKAELGMLGMQTSIQKVTINNRETYHRVRVGPFTTLDELDRTRQTLKKKGIDSTPIKVRG